MTLLNLLVGLPMIESLQGRDGLALGLLIDQLGSYLVLSTVGVFAAAVYAVEKQGGLRGAVRKVATFPPFIALMVALMSRSVPLPADVDKVLIRMGDTMAPLALIAVGLQLRVDAIREKVALLSLGLHPLGQRHRGVVEAGGTRDVHPVADHDRA